MPRRQDERVQAALEVGSRRLEADVQPAREGVPESMAGADVGGVAAEGGVGSGEDVWGTGGRAHFVFVLCIPGSIFRIVYFLVFFGRGMGGDDG